MGRGREGERGGIRTEKLVGNDCYGFSKFNDNCKLTHAKPSMDPEQKKYRVNNTNTHYHQMS